MNRARESWPWGSAATLHKKAKTKKARNQQNHVMESTRDGVHEV